MFLKFQKKKHSRKYSEIFRILFYSKIFRIFTICKRNIQMSVKNIICMSLIYFENVSYIFRKILILPKIPGQVIRESVFRTKFYFEKHIQCVFILEPNFKNHFTNEVLRSLYSLPDDSCLRVNALRRDPLSAEMYTARSFAIFMKYTRSIHTIF